MNRRARRAMYVAVAAALVALCLAPVGVLAKPASVAPFTLYETELAPRDPATIESIRLGFDRYPAGAFREPLGPPLTAAASDEPTIPTGLDGIGLNRVVYLTWDDDPNAVSFNIYRKKSVETSYALLGSLTGNEGYDASAENEYVYDYRVSAVSVGDTETAPSKPIRLDPRPAPVDRVAGNDRYETAVAVSEYNFESAETVVLASGAGFADALAASPLCGLYRAPLLLTEPGRLPAVVLDELDRLGAEQVFVVGGVAAVSGSVSSSLQSLGYKVMRIGGNNRYHTAELITRYVVANGADDVAWLGEDPDTEQQMREVMICRGDVFPDALSVAPFAYLDVTPILLVAPDYVPVETQRAMVELQRDGIMLIGGEGAIPESTVAWLYGTPGGWTKWGQRIWGDDRYYTSVAVTQRYQEAMGGFFALGFATGENYPDALGGGMACGEWYGGLLLTDPAGLNRGASAVLDRFDTTVQVIEVFGGTAVVPETIVTEVEGIVD